MPIITPCLNAERTIRQTIESIRNQSFKNWEMLVADDCSGDSSRAILQEAAAHDLRIRPLFTQENGGAECDRNRAIDAAVSYKDVLKSTIVGCLTVMLDRRQTGNFHMSNLRSRQNLATWLSLLRSGLTAYGLNQVLAEYRISGKNSLSGNKWSAATKTWHVYRRVEGLPLLKSCWYFGHYAVHAARKYF